MASPSRIASIISRVRIDWKLFGALLGPRSVVFGNWNKEGERYGRKLRGKTGAGSTADRMPPFPDFCLLTADFCHRHYSIDKI
jgi:hypothetical protein